MKRLLITLLLAVLSTSAMAEWVQTSESDNLTAYADHLKPIRKVGDKVKMWTMSAWLQRWDVVPKVT